MNDFLLLNFVTSVISVCRGARFRGEWSARVRVFTVPIVYRSALRSGSMCLQPLLLVRSQLSRLPSPFSSHPFFTHLFDTYSVVSSIPYLSITFFIVLVFTAARSARLCTTLRHQLPPPLRPRRPLPLCAHSCSLRTACS